MSGIVSSEAHKSPTERRTRQGRGLIIVFTAAMTVVVPLLLPMTAYNLNLLMQASTYAVAVLGLTIVLGYAGQINLAQAAFFGLGAYSVALGTVCFGLPFWPALFVGVVIASVAGAVLGLTSLRLGGHYLAMVTISFQQILTLVLANWISLTRGPDGIPGIARPIVFGFSFADSGTYLALCVGMLWVVGFCVGRLKHSKLGRAMQAVRDNELAAGVAGVDTYWIKVIAFTLSALLGGLGGGLFAGGFTYISPDQFGFAESVVFLTMALLGGARSAFGAALGTALLILLPEWLRFLKVTYLAVYGGAVILLMVFMPEGIWGFLEAVRRRVWPPSTVRGGRVPLLPLTAQVMRDEGSTILEVSKLSKHFGGLKAVDKVELSIRQNTVHALIGPNGSGKTTLLNVLSGTYKPLRFCDQSIAGLSPEAIARLGVAHVPERRRVFPGLTVRENILLGGSNRIRASRRELETDAERMFAVFPELKPFTNALGWTLSGGQQQMLAIARGLMAQPRLLLLDDPSLGLAPLIVQQVFKIIAEIRGQGTTVLLVEQNAHMALLIADRGYVLETGRLVAEGNPEALWSNDEVHAAYLGGRKME